MTLPPTEPTGDPNPPEPFDTATAAPPSEQPDQHLDGNAAGGALGAIFAFEMTMALATCDSCGTTNPLGADMAYMYGMGTILRCATCDTALIRIAHVQDRYYLDLRGVRVLRIAAETASA
jgi:uncharacterized protein DUF6510